MGSAISIVSDDKNVPCTAGRKRPYPFESEPFLEHEETETFSPARKQLRPTARYIFESLFEHGVQSDITVKAIGPDHVWEHEWKLHKMFLRQAGYFESMFSGRWAEAGDTSEVLLHVTDINVDVEGLNTAFASLYCDDYEVNVSNLVSVIAAASMLQLDGLLSKSAAAVEKHINNSTVSNLCQAAAAYGHWEMEEKCMRWLERHLLTKMTDDALHTLSFDLLKRLVGSPTLFVVHIELDVYLLCRKWMYIQLFPEQAAEVIRTGGDLGKAAGDYYKGIKTEDGPAFLETSEGKPFADLFRLLRLQYILNDSRNITVMEADGIIPKSWITDSYTRCWRSLLNGGELKFDDAAFETGAMRCGRQLERNRQITWRWTGFSYGIDILVSYSAATRLFTIKRNTVVRAATYNNANSLSCLHDKRKLKYRFSAVSFGEQGEEKAFRTTGLREHVFAVNEEVVLFRLDDDVDFPLFVSLQAMVQGIDTEVPSV